MHYRLQSENRYTFILKNVYQTERLVFFEWAVFFADKQFNLKIALKYSATETNQTVKVQHPQFAIHPPQCSQWPFYADEHKFNLLFVQLPLASTLFFSCLDLLTQQRQVFCVDCPPSTIARDHPLRNNCNVGLLPRGEASRQKLCSERSRRLRCQSKASPPFFCFCKLD